LETLNVEYPPVPEESEVRARYRSLALESHPDQGGDADRFIEVQKAWEVVTEGEELTDRVQEMEVTQGS
jgi:curved DNA-binding protein CbpA